MKTYAEKRFFEWREDDLSVSLRAKSGSYGGGSEVFVVFSMPWCEEQRSDRRADNFTKQPEQRTDRGLRNLFHARGKHGDGGICADDR